MTQKKQAKGFNLIFAGILLAMVLVILAFVTVPSLLNIFVICVSSLALMLYGSILLGICLLSKRKINAKLLTLVVLILFTTSQSWAKGNDNKEFKHLYQKTVAKLTSENQDTIKFRVFRLNETAILSIVYEKSRACLCNDQQCHGPRLTLSANFGKTHIFILPNGYCFSETSHSGQSGDIIKVDIQAETTAEAAFKKAAKETLLAYIK